MQSLDLTLDDATDARIRDAWRALGEAALPSQANHAGASNRPHVTVLARLEVPVPRSSAVEALPLRVTIGAPIIFGSSRPVIALLVIPSAELLDLQARLVAEAGPGERSPFEAAGRWTPHITLARGIAPDDLGRALHTIATEEFDGSVTALRHWDSVTKTVTEIGSG